MSKTFQDYQDLKLELDAISANHKAQGNTGLDASWIRVGASGLNWREAKKLGFTKDYYYGWTLYSTSTNSSGYDLFEKIQEACRGFSVRVREKQL